MYMKEPNLSSFKNYDLLKKFCQIETKYLQEKTPKRLIELFIGYTHIFTNASRDTLNFGFKDLKKIAKEIKLVI